MSPGHFIAEKLNSSGMCMWAAGRKDSHRIGAIIASTVPAV